MLIKMSSEAFKTQNNKIRPPIEFHKGLNVILGNKTGKNSIGKTSAMLALDFVFGGNTYQKSDCIDYVGHHSVEFVFRFDGKDYHFSRHTQTPGTVMVLPESAEFGGTTWKTSEFTAWLQNKYHFDIPNLSFRTAVSGFFRVYGKKNADESNPLLLRPGMTTTESIETLLKIFGRYEEIQHYSKEYALAKNRKETFNNARKLSFVPNLVGGDKQLEENLRRIQELQYSLSSYAFEEDRSELSPEELEAVGRREQAKREKLRLDHELQEWRSKLRLLDLSLEYGSAPTNANLEALLDYFPNFNIRKLYEVEEFHKNLTRILTGQLEDERALATKEIKRLECELSQINAVLNSFSGVPKFSSEALEQLAKIQQEIANLKAQNDAYQASLTYKEAFKEAKFDRDNHTREILRNIERQVNDSMADYNRTIFPSERKIPPVLTLNSCDSFTFKTPRNSGTGSNYKGLIVFDLSVLRLTQLPFLGHDSIVFKNVDDETIQKILAIYENSEKQIFISLDKKDSYNSKSAADILEGHAVLHLSGNGEELYGWSWDEAPEDEDIGDKEYEPLDGNNDAAKSPIQEDEGSHLDEADSEDNEEEDVDEDDDSPPAPGYLF